MLDSDLKRNIAIAVNQAMEAAKGSRNVAAKALGWEPIQLHTYFSEHPEMEARWHSGEGGPTKAPTDLSTINRECVVPAEKRPPLDNENAALAIAVSTEMKKANFRFRNGFPSLGFAQEEIDYAASLAAWQGEHFSEVAAMVSGGMAHTSVRVMMRIQKLADRLNKGFDETGGPPLGELDAYLLSPDQILQAKEMAQRAKDLAMREEDKTLTHFRLLCETLVKMSQCAQDGNLTRAKIQQIKKEIQKNAAAPKPSKAGWGPPLQAQKTEVHLHGSAGAERSATVTITETSGNGSTTEPSQDHRPP